MHLRLEEVPYIGHLLTPEGLKPDPEKIKAILQMPKAIPEILGLRYYYRSKFIPKLPDVCVCAFAKSDTKMQPGLNHLSH